jgi:hypothetical protein
MDRAKQLECRTFSVSARSPSPPATAIDCKVQRRINDMTTSSTAIDRIDEDEIDEAQRAWCEGLKAICREYIDHGENGNYRRMAGEFIDDLYDFEKGQVFFRPTLAMAPQNFRTTREGALSYFIGGDPDNFPNDKGFIKEKWVSVWFDNEIEGKRAVQVHGDVAIAMGNVYLSKHEVVVGGKMVVVDKVFVFFKRDGRLRLIVHNSALSNIPDSEVPEDDEDAQ